MITTSQEGTSSNEVMVGTVKIEIETTSQRRTVTMRSVLSIEATSQWGNPTITSATRTRTGGSAKRPWAKMTSKNTNGSSRFACTTVI